MESGSEEMHDADHMTTRAGLGFGFGLQGFEAWL